ncbi:14950_t:CDS:2, partial [Entrophospora sp. SA101]
PSVAAGHQLFSKQQKIANIQCGRPPKYVGEPVVLYHPIFSDFLQDCEKDDYVDKTLCVETLKFLNTMSKFYKIELIRQSAIADFYHFLFGKTFNDGSPKNDGYIMGTSVINGISLEIPVILRDIKNEISQGSCDPVLQSAICYEKFWCGNWSGKPEGYNQIREMSVCPTFLLCSAGIVLADKIKVETLTDMLYLVPTLDSNKLLHFAHTFSSLRHACKNSYNTIIICDAHISPLVFSANSTNENYIIKYTQHYNGEVHKLCENHGGSPQLFETYYSLQLNLGKPCAITMI